MDSDVTGLGVWCKNGIKKKSLPSDSNVQPAWEPWIYRISTAVSHFQNSKASRIFVVP